MFHKVDLSWAVTVEKPFLFSFSSKFTQCFHFNDDRMILAEFMPFSQCCPLKLNFPHFWFLFAFFPWGIFSPITVYLLLKYFTPLDVQLDQSCYTASLYHIQDSSVCLLNIWLNRILLMRQTSKRQQNCCPTLCPQYFLFSRDCLIMLYHVTTAVLKSCETLLEICG